MKYTSCSLRSLRSVKIFLDRVGERPKGCAQEVERVGRQGRARPQPQTRPQPQIEPRPQREPHPNLLLQPRAQSQPQAEPQHLTNLQPQPRLQLQDKAGHELNLKQNPNLKQNHILKHSHNLAKTLYSTPTTTSKEPITPTSSTAQPQPYPKFNTQKYTQINNNNINRHNNRPDIVKSRHFQKSWNSVKVELNMLK